MDRSQIFYEIAKERARQDQRWGEQRKHHVNLWVTILAEEFGEVARAALENDKEGFKREILQVAAVASAILEFFDGVEWG